jgi:LytS/YehU family sensor histidine kinase
VTTAVWVFVGAGIARLLGLVPAFEGLPERYAREVPVLFGAGVLMYLLSVALHYVLIEIEAAREAERREAALELLARQAELESLKSQIQPHFLFNSLNSIAQLIHVDPAKAEACVERLGEIFRYLLNRAEQEFVPLAEELQMTNAYLEIERARFDERLRVETLVDPGALRQMIPNLLLQPLVENAVKHGLSRKVGPGTLRIAARLDDTTLTLVVGDDGLGMSSSILANVFERGVGLRNLRARLERLYGPAYLPQITSTPGGGTRVEVRLPASARVPQQAA